MREFRINEKNISVTMSYDELQRIMKECVTTTMKMYEDEKKKVQEQKWCSTSTTAKMFGVNVSTINRWKHAGYLTPRTVGGRDFFSIDEINSIINNQKISS